MAQIEFFSPFSGIGPNIICLRTVLPSPIRFDRAFVVERKHAQEASLDQYMHVEAPFMHEYIRELYSMKLGDPAACLLPGALLPVAPFPRAATSLSPSHRRHTAATAPERAIVASFLAARCCCMK